MPGRRPSQRPRDQRGGRPPRRDAPARDERRPARDERRPARGARPAGTRRAPGRTEDKGAVWKPGPSARTVGAETGMDLAHFIAEAGEGLSVRAIRRALDAGSCRVNGAVERFGSRKLKRGDVVEFFIPRSPRDHDFEAARVVHEDEAVIAYDKPAGLPVTPDDAGRKWNLQAMLRDRYGFAVAVHRLDADTSGVVLFGRTEAASRRMEEAFRDHQVKKTYLALVRGHPRESGEYRSYLVKTGGQKGAERWASGRGQDAREAVTTWSLEERVGPWASLVKVEPLTGRYHQIRIHFSELGHPIYGDRLYGDRRDPIHVTRHLLHGWRVDLPHPAEKRTLSVKTPFPDDFAQAMKALRKLG